MTEATPKVSVMMLAHNHARFVRQAVESVLSQDVSFPYEIVIGEDCSTDGTREIVVELARCHPETIRLLAADLNLGMQTNFQRTLSACHGEYIAILEADDYWTAPHKLHNQVEFLDQHPECVSCFHDAAIEHEGDHSANTSFVPVGQKPLSNIEDLFAECFVPTCSLLFRNGLVEQLPGWMWKLAMVDWPFNILLAQHGKIAFLAEEMAVYRVHSGGFWSTRGVVDRLRQKIDMLDFVNAHLGYVYDQAIRRELAKTWSWFAGAMGRQAAERSTIDASVGELRLALDRRTAGPPLPAGFKSRMLSQFYLAVGFTAHERHQWAQVLWSVAQAALRDMACLANRGVWSICTQALLRRSSV